MSHRLALLTGAFVSAFAVQQGIAQSTDIPTPSDAEKVSEDAKGDGKHYYYKSSSSAGDLVSSYKSQLESAGWTIDSSSSGGSSWGGDGELTATKGQSYLVLAAGGETGRTNIDLCVWPSKPSNTDC